MIEFLKPEDYEPVPTLRELHAKGLASVLERTTKGEPTIFRPTPEGQQLIYDAMARNADRMKRRDHERQGLPEGSGRVE